VATEATLEQARGGDDQAFGELTDPYLGELRLHCYRILGSVQDAEDVLQETLLAAWRGLGQYEQRASLRTWLYRIATNRCLNALRASERRPRTAPAGPGFLTVEPTRRGEPVWLEPYPDALLEGLPDTGLDPEARYEAKEAVALAFVTAVQHLPARQRAVLVLRDVLGFRAAEVAGMLESSEASVNSALQRARATMAQRRPGPDRERAPLPRSARERDVAGRFATAFALDDIDAVVALLTEDAWLTMPPATLEFQGPEAIAGFLRDVRGWRGSRRYRLVPVRANGQPAFGCYLQERPDGVFGAHGMIVLTLAGDRISAVTRFVDNSNLARFGLPPMLTSVGEVADAAWPGVW
jgi:RNA polymerase sigma-70 factor (TIGR02960 family)